MIEIIWAIAITAVLTVSFHTWIYILWIKKKHKMIEEKMVQNAQSFFSKLDILEENLEKYRKKDHEVGNMDEDLKKAVKYLVEKMEANKEEIKDYFDERMEMLEEEAEGVEEISKDESELDEEFGEKEAQISNPPDYKGSRKIAVPKEAAVKEKKGFGLFAKKKPVELKDEFE